MTKCSLGEAWIQCLQHVLRLGKYTTDDQVHLLEASNISIVITDISISDPIIQKYADQERIKLMYRKYESLDIVTPFNISYGACLYSNQGVNQIQTIIDRLKRKPETKAATISLHTPGEEKPTCLSLIDCKLRNGYLNFTAVYRSQNVYGSQPGNVLALAKVHRNIATALESNVGLFNLYVISAHIYENDIEVARKIVEDIRLNPLG